MHPNPKLRLPALLGILAALLVLTAGCSRTTFVYNNADWMIMRWADSLLDPDRDQKAAWQVIFDEVLAQHRQQLLPELIAGMTIAEQHLENGLDEQHLDCLISAGDELYRRHATLVVPAAAKVLASLEPQQVAYLREQLAERNLEYREKMLFENAERQLQARIERYTERIESWTGNLSSEQQQLIAREVSSLPDIADTWLGYREHKQAGLIQLLSTSPGPEQLNEYLHAWWVEFAERPSELIAANRQIRTGMTRMLTKLSKQLSTQQLEQAIGKLRSWRQGLESVTDTKLVAMTDIGYLAACQT